MEQNERIFGLLRCAEAETENRSGLKKISFLLTQMHTRTCLTQLPPPSVSYILWYGTWYLQCFFLRFRLKIVKSMNLLLDLLNGPTHFQDTIVMPFSGYFCFIFQEKGRVGNIVTPVLHAAQ